MRDESLSLKIHLLRLQLVLGGPAFQVFDGFVVLLLLLLLRGGEVRSVGWLVELDLEGGSRVCWFRDGGLLLRLII